MEQDASLDDDVNKMTPEAVERLRNPPQVPIDVESRGIQQSISMYLALEHASQDAYEQICQAMYSGSKKCPNICMFFSKVNNP